MQVSGSNANKTSSATFNESSVNQIKLHNIADIPTVIDFDGGMLSSDAGILLLAEVEKEVGIIKAIAEVIPDHRNQSYVDHSVSDLLLQRVLQISSGYEDANDCNPMRYDPIFKIIAERLPLDGSPLASQPTMSRFENSISRSTLYRIAEILLDNFISSYDKPPRLIVFDFDDTDDTTYGGQQLCMFNNYYKDYCFMPLHVYEGLSGKLIATILKPGKRSDGQQMLSILERIVSRVRDCWPETILIFRGDSHFAYPEVMNWIEARQDMFHVTGLSGNSRLNKEVQAHIERATQIYRMWGRKTTLFHSFYYQADSWTIPRRVVAKIEVGEQGRNIRFVVTNMEEANATVLYRNIYCARGQDELYIKEHKLYLKSDRTSCHRFQANQFRLFLHSAAYVLLHALRANLLKGTELANASFHTIRIKLFKVAALVRQFKTRIKVQLPSCYPLKDIFIKASEILRILRTT